MKKTSKMYTTMKKAFFLVAVATLTLLSCQKENVKNDVKGITLTASIEALSTKADMNASNQLVWAKGDKIGIYVNGWGDNCNQSFTLKGDGGSTTGSFGRTSEEWFDTDQAQIAFFPWTSANATTVNTATDNNVSGSTVYFKLPQSYTDYTSGKMLTPLVAPMTYTSAAYAPIMFKHAGAAVKVTINNLPAGSHSIGMKVDGQQIYGDFHIDANASAAMVVDSGAENSAQNEIWLNYEPASSERVFTFVFPVPALTTPKLIFKIYDENDILVWEKKLKAQASDLGRGDVLVMPATDITPYAQFNAVSPKWTVKGTANGTNWATYIPMVTDGTLCIAKGLSFEADGAFKICEDGNFAYPDSNWNIWEGAGSYDIIFNTSTHDITVVKSKCPYPAAQQNGGSSSGFTTKPGFDNTGWTIQ